MLRRNLEFDRDMGHDARAEVWYAAYMLSTGDPEAVQSAFAPFEELVELRCRLAAAESQATADASRDPVQPAA